MADKDSRTYIRIHDGMPDHPKVDGLSDGAFRLLVTCWCYCSRYLTDGCIPSKVWSRKGNGRYRNELRNAGLVEMDLETGDAYFHDYLDHQRSAAEVADLRKRRQEAGSLGGKAKAKGLASAIANAKAKGKQNLPIDIDIDKGKNTAAPSGFAEFWSAYPKKVGKPAAEKAWNKAVKDGAEPSHLTLAASQYGEQTANTDPKFICHPTTWLNQARYNDEAGSEAAPAPRRYVPLEVPDHIDPDDAQAYAAWLREAAQ